MGGDFKLTAKGDKTVLRSTLNYSMSNSFYGVMNNLMGKSDFTKVWASVLAGYKHHIETGEHVTEDTKLQVDQVVLIDAGGEEV
ncbi:MAG: hypothetical protein H0U74_08215 [Bradymonadaceae bacterium]|nr:hypothetical protein [Lujinxingiaceae bacterium]